MSCFCLLYFDFYYNIDLWAPGRALSVSFNEICSHCFVRSMKEIWIKHVGMFNEMFFPIDDLENHVY